MMVRESSPAFTRLRLPAEFRHVYDRGKRYDGHLMSAFVHPNNLPHHRIGITASRKAIGNAVARNRAKRLLRETFRLSYPNLDELQTKCDFVLNARRRLLSVKLSEPLEEFRRIVADAVKHERRGVNYQGVHQRVER